MRPSTTIIKPERGYGSVVGFSSGVDRVDRRHERSRSDREEEVRKVEKGPYGGRGFYDPQSEVNRLFDEMFGGLGNTGRRQQRTPQTQWAPVLDVVHADGDLLNRAERPGAPRAARAAPPSRRGRLCSTSSTRTVTCSSEPSCPASSAKTWR